MTSQHGLGPILELGAGTGLVGLSAAALWRTNVVLTDLAPILPALQENVLLNRNLLDGRRGSVTCGILDWRDPSALKSYPLYTSHDQSHELLVSPDSEDNKFSMILAADTVYDPSHPEMLVEVIKKWLKRGDESRVLIAYPMRVAYLEEIRELWTRISGIGLEVLEEGKEELPEMEWDDERLVEWCVWKWKV